MWSKETKACVLQDGCSRDLNTGKHPCSQRGTRRCVSTMSNLAQSDGTAQMKLPFICLCWPGFMGSRCDQPRDACIEVTLAFFFIPCSRTKIQQACLAARRVVSTWGITVSPRWEKTFTRVVAAGSLKKMIISSIPTVIEQKGYVAE